MDFLAVFLLMLSLTSTESAKSATVKRRLYFLENQVNKLESRVSSETNKLQVELYEVSSTVLDLNSSLYEHEADCRNDNKQVSITQQTKPKDMEAAFQDTNQRLMAAFSDEKSKLREAFDRIDQHLEEISQNNTRQSTLEIQTLRSEYNDLKQIVEEISQNNTRQSTLEIQTLRSEYNDLRQIVEEISQNNTRQSTLEIQTLRSEYNDLKQIVETISATVEEIHDELVYHNETHVTAMEMKESITLSSLELKELVNTQIKDLKTTVENKKDLKELVKLHIKDLKTSIDVKGIVCPTFWSQYGQFCYRYFKDRVVYSEARRVCADNGASVVDLQSKNEVDFVKGLTGRASWISLTDIEEEGVYKWDRTDSEASFVNWYPGESESDSVNESFDCVSSAFLDGDWLTYNCRLQFSFVCKKTL